MKKETYSYNGLNFEIETISQENSLEDTDLIVVLKYDGEILETYDVHHETAADFKCQNKDDLKHKLYGIAKKEIELKFGSR
ncbi:hypothetical protein NQ787_17690 [Acinetobacter baumannii]|uniref:hypothetical protein n=1 Tax=Acinetobacter baumannii TaxID=470 RepID=UPI0004007858|nr:hypothetical protein [Acinetobacter baumannii]MDC4509347.1 hypothetical protein [Acinetobacter baumannii]